MIDTQAFIRTLKETHGYETPAEVTLGLGDRLFGRFDWWYYRRLAGVIRRGSWLYRHKRYDRVSWQDLSLDMWRAVEGCGGHLFAEGLENLEKTDGPAVIVANHMSMLETFTIPAAVLPFHHMTFVVKESLMRVPVFRNVMRGVRPIVVTRANPREDMKILMGDGEAVLREGRSVVVFPQATRSVVVRPGQFNSVAVKLAKRAGVPVVPLALKTDFQSLGRLVKDLGGIHRDRRVCFSFGEPLAVEGNGKAAHAAAVRYIAGKYRSWGGEVAEDASDRDVEI